MVLGILARKGYRSVSELAEDLAVSEMTVRRYLDKLERKELIKRTHGGAFAGQEMIEVDYRVRETVRRAEKEAIGRLAWTLIQPGESVFLDAGSTLAYLASAMDDTRRITVVTNSTIVLQTLENRANIDTILLGGRVHAASHSLIGPIAEETVAQFRFTEGLPRRRGHQPRGGAHAVQRGRGAGQEARGRERQGGDRPGRQLEVQQGRARDVPPPGPAPHDHHGHRHPRRVTAGASRSAASACSLAAPAPAAGG